MFCWRDALKLNKPFGTLQSPKYALSRAPPLYLPPPFPIWCSPLTPSFLSTKSDGIMESLHPPRHHGGKKGVAAVQYTTHDTRHATKC